MSEADPFLKDVSDETPKVGVLGAGQLALMLAEAGATIGIEVIVAGKKGDCAGRVARLVEVDFADRAAVEAFAAGVDIVTIESENIDVAVLDHVTVAPNARAIEIAQDRLLEKRFFDTCGIETAPFAPVSDAESLAAAVAKIGVPAILKTRRMGYDGKGQARIASQQEAGAAWESLGRAPCILEGLVAFDYEVSLIAARGELGQVEFYPLTRNEHAEGILRRSTAPHDNPELQAEAEGYLSSLLAQLDYVGVLAVEFFVKDGRLIANEMAPRVHNSGHWTIEGAKTSQFENHLRAICGLTLGRTDAEASVMINCIGTMAPESETTGGVLHDYGKEARPGRKVGHVTYPADRAPK